MNGGSRGYVLEESASPFVGLVGADGCGYPYWRPTGPRSICVLGELGTADGMSEGVNVGDAVGKALGVPAGILLGDALGTLEGALL